MKWFAAALLSDTTPAANGGRMTLTEIVSGVKNNLFPDVSQAQRTAGVTHWRKAFVAVRNAHSLPLINPRVSIEAGTPGDSYVLIYPGTQTDTQNQLTARPYGFGTLAADAALGAESITVTAESAAFAALSAKPFQVGDLLRIDARATVLSAGAYDYVAIASVSYSGATLTIGLAAPLEHAYTAGAKVASVITPADVATAASAITVTTTGTLAVDASKLTLNNLGCVYQTWTVTLTNAATGALSVSGDLLGVVGTGALGAALAPVNPASGQPYFRLESSAWSGSPVTGDTIQFTTTPAAIPLWYQRVVPAGAGAIATDPVSICIEGESA